MNLIFKKKVGKTIGIGQVTVPREFYSVLDKRNYCSLGLSVDVKYVLPNGFQIPGRLYQSENNTTTYYQFYIIEQSNKKVFEKQIKNHRELNFDFMLTNRCLYVRPQ